MYSASYFNSGGLGAFFGGLSPQKPSHGDGTATDSHKNKKQRRGSVVHHTNYCPSSQLVTMN